MNFEKMFFEKLAILARVCGFTIDSLIVKAYDQNLSRYGYEAICKALDHIFINRRTRDPFPSIKEIISQVVPETDAETEAIEASARIIQGVSRYGYPNSIQAQQFIGPLGWRVVERFGGWANICQTLTQDNVAILQAHFRKVAMTTHIRALQGFDEVAPVIPLRSKRNESEQKQLMPAGKVLESAFDFNFEDEFPSGA